MNIAKEFDTTVNLSSIILTRVDGDARGGAALSMKHVTGKPIKYIGVGEKVSDFEMFHPDRLANRILGMGDVVTLVEKAEAAKLRDAMRKLEASELEITLNPKISNFKKGNKIYPQGPPASVPSFTAPACRRCSTWSPNSGATTALRRSCSWGISTPSTGSAWRGSPGEPSRSASTAC